MVISFNPVVCFSRMMQISGSPALCSVPRKLQVSPPVILLNSRQLKRPKHGQLRLFVAESDRVTTNLDTDSSGNPEKSVPPLDDESNKTLPISSSSITSGPTLEDKDTSSSPNVQTRRASLTAREKLRAARVLSRYNETKATASKAAMGSKVLDALKESDKGKKGLPEAPTNLFDDSKRGMPKKGLTFDFPGSYEIDGQVDGPSPPGKRIRLSINQVTGWNGAKCGPSVVSLSVILNVCNTQGLILILCLVQGSFNHVSYADSVYCL